MLAKGFREKDEVVGSVPLPVSDFARIARYENDSEIGATATSRFNEIEPSDAVRHYHIGEQQIDRLLALKDTFRFHAITRGQDSVTEPIQEHFDHVPNIGLILDDQDGLSLAMTRRWIFCGAY